MGDYSVPLHTMNYSQTVKMDKGDDSLQSSQTGDQGEMKERQSLDILGNFKDFDASGYEKKMERRCIYKCPYGLTTIKDLENTHIPQLVSFGPYHFGKEHLQAMQFHKRRALHMMLSRTHTINSPIEKQQHLELGLQSFKERLRQVEEELRDCYDQLGPEWSSSKDFLEMMLLDGCFMLELLRSQEPPSDPIFGSRGSPYIRAVLCRDMLMLENQIPLLCLKRLLLNSSTEGLCCTAPDAYVNRLIINFFDFKLDPRPDLGRRQGLHVLDVYRECLIQCPPSPYNQDTTELQRKMSSAFIAVVATTRMKQKAPYSPASDQPDEHPVKSPEAIGGFGCLPLWNRRHDDHGPNECTDLPSATRLHEAGVTFKRSTDGRFSDIHFDRRTGVLELPFLEIDNHTVDKFMNLISFERMHPKAGGHVTSYFVFMDALLDRAEDVRLLIDNGVVTNELGSNAAASRLFNTLGDGVVERDGLVCQISEADTNHVVKLRISEVRRELNAYASSSLNTWTADLKHKYFDSPWACLSLFAAIFLIVLTIVQTAYAILSYHRSSP